MRENEQWRHVLGFSKAYAVTSHGRVWSARRRKWMRQPPNPKGYLRVSLKDPETGRRRDYFTHSLVAAYFVDNPRLGFYAQVKHLDGDRTNNHADNLRWYSQSLDYAKARLAKALRRRRK